MPSFGLCTGGVAREDSRRASTAWVSVKPEVLLSVLFPRTWSTFRRRLPLLSITLVSLKMKRRHDEEAAEEAPLVSAEEKKVPEVAPASEATSEDEEELEEEEIAA